MRLKVLIEIDDITVEIRQDISECGGFTSQVLGANIGYAINAVVPCIDGGLDKALIDEIIDVLKTHQKFSMRCKK